jgi:hypothetical protein
MFPADEASCPFSSEVERTKEVPGAHSQGVTFLRGGIPHGHISAVAFLADTGLHFIILFNNII